jgi:AbrB family looped-hinge helix DNA binding protein
MKSTISAKGQITVPSTVRERLGLRPGTVVVFDLCDGGVLMRKGVGDEHPVDLVFGILDLPAPVDELIDQQRGPRPRPKRKRR